MRYGFVVPWADADAIGDLAATAEASGWDGLFVWEPVWGVDAWISLAIAATRTTSIRLGTMLTPPSRRRPWELASQVATVDRLSEGRVTLSVGLGAIDSGFAAFGEETDRRTRAELLDECLDIVTGLWAGQPFTYEGTHYHVQPTEFPTIGETVQQPRVPIWCVGMIGRPKSMARALRWDGLLPQTAGGNHPTLAEISAIREGLGDRDYDIVIEGEGNEHSPAAWASAGATWWIESMWGAVNEIDAALAANDRLLQGPPQVTLSHLVGSWQGMLGRTETERAKRANAVRPTQWNFADVWEAVADRLPDAPAQRHAGISWTWQEFDRRADAVAAYLLSRGVVEQDKVAQYLYNGPEYLESVFAAFKAGLAVVNTNYRYRPDELTYLWDNADVVAVVFHGAFVEQCEAVRGRLPAIHTWLWVDDNSGPCPAWATAYEAAASPWPGRTQGPWGRTGDHLLLLYTGGTTGAPKGVMWRQDDLFRALDQLSRRRPPPPADVADLVAQLDRPGPSSLPGAPLMHGTALFNALTTLSTGGSIVTLAGRHFDPVELLDTVERERVKSMTIVGDAFGRPILRALDAEPSRWDISSLRVIVSSGVMWSKETKDGLLRHNARLILVDTLGSSEAIGMATSATTADASTASASFRLAANTRVITEQGDGRCTGIRRGGARGDVRADAARLLQGSEQVGGHLPHRRRGALHDPRRLGDGRHRRHRAAARPRQPVHQHRRREGLPGRGRGGAQAAPRRRRCRRRRRPRRALRRGDPRAWSNRPSGAEIDEAALITHVKERLAAYKAPKRVIPVSSVNRAPNGKLDYKALREAALRSPDPTMTKGFPTHD